MKIPVDEIPESPKEIKFSESIAELNETFAKGKASDFRFPPLVDVDLVYYRSGRELFFRGSFSGQLEGSCSRCLKNFSMPVDHEFEFVLSPDPFGSSGATEELRREELGLSYYCGDEINLGPLIREQVILALKVAGDCVVVVERTSITRTADAPAPRRIPGWRSFARSESIAKSH
jgi:uncharacterized protein